MKKMLMALAFLALVGGVEAKKKQGAVSTQDTEDCCNKVNSYLIYNQNNFPVTKKNFPSCKKIKQPSLGTFDYYAKHCVSRSRINFND